jgi:hypothetical protein
VAERLLSSEKGLGSLELVNVDALWFRWGRNCVKINLQQSFRRIDVFAVHQSEIERMQSIGSIMN